MTRGKKFFKQNDIVIVLEGTTTEYNYFDKLCRYAKENGYLPFSDYRIIPSIEKNQNSTGAAPKGFRKAEKKKLMGDKDNNRYYTKFDTPDGYKEYHRQPTRYVREAQLMVIEDGFSQGWAVYDRDHHADHLRAVQLQKSDPQRLHIAFSAYSFEEWILCHFEANPQAFLKSDCSDAKDKSYRCGSHRAVAGHDCEGTVCIAGRLRKMNYIPDFAKNQSDLFEKYLKPAANLVPEQALINASWLRFRKEGQERHEANPYTDVDVLVRILLGDDRKFEWHNSGDIFAFDKGKICITKENEKITITNKSEVPVFIPLESIEMESPGKSGIRQPVKSILLQPDRSFELPTADAVRLMLTDNNRRILIPLT